MNGPTWEASLRPKDGSVVEGDKRQIGIVFVVRLDMPGDEPVKVGTREVRAWTNPGLERKGQRVADEIIDRDRRKIRTEIQARIDRLQAQLTSE